ncbi:MAG: type II secretion system protein GspE [Acidobacteria bacterium]|nr:MAG: type II secretion system protein GspE [Acidobacteriota bacterium]
MALAFDTASSSSRRKPALAAVQKRAPVPRPHSRAALGAILLERELITEAQLNAAIDQQKRTGRRLGHVLIDMGATTQDAVLGALSVQLGLPGMRINAYTVKAEAIEALPEKVARGLGAFPISKVGTTLTVAVATPLDLEAIDNLRFASGCEIHTVVALEDEIGSALDRYYQADGIPHQLAQDTEEVVVEASLVDRRAGGDRRHVGGRRATDLLYSEPDKFDEAAERSAVTILDRVLARAVSEGASDIHLESTLDSFRVRFRVDGTFREIATFAPQLASAVVARLKVLSGMDIAEHRLPQDGRFSATVGSRRLDLRSSTYPTMYGEKAVLRLLDRTALRLHLETMGMRGKVLDQFRSLIRRPEGMILVTGPTGSGKTSTLYASLAELVETGKHIITIEDPETLSTAVEASLTGHLVFSTLHTNSAVATVARVVDMGLEPYLLSSCLSAIVAQRLVRRICPTCRTEIPTPAGVSHLFAGCAPETMYRGAGCHDCRGTGYRGRVAIHELFVVNEELRSLILERAPEPKLAEVAARSGMVALRDECLTRVREGETTLEEVVRLTQERS